MAAQALRRQDSTGNFSVLSKHSTTRATAQEVHDLVYAHDVHALSPEDVENALQRIYEPNAMWDPNFYENPFLTATSRTLIKDIYHASRQFSEIDIPSPLALFTTRTAPWFRALRAWSEIVDICETESFDGHRKSIIEHTLHILLLPGLHAGQTSQHPHGPSDSTLDLSLAPPPPLYSLLHLQRTSQPSLVLPGTRMALPSPLHITLPILTRLHFNDIGQVTHHRDFWDVKDLVAALVPGAALAQFVGTRIAARALATAGTLSAWLFTPAVAVNKRACSTQRPADSAHACAYDRTEDPLLPYIPDPAPDVDR